MSSSTIPDAIKRIFSPLQTLCLQLCLPDPLVSKIILLRVLSMKAVCSLLPSFL